MPWSWLDKLPIFWDDHQSMIWVYVHNNLTMARMSYPLQRMTPSPRKRQSEGVLLGVGAAFFCGNLLEPFRFSLHSCGLCQGRRSRSFFFVFAFLRLKVTFFQWPFQVHKLEVPTICKGYVREYPHKIWPYMVQYLHFGS